MRIKLYKKDIADMIAIAIKCNHKNSSLYKTCKQCNTNHKKKYKPAVLYRNGLPWCYNKGWDIIIVKIVKNKLIVSEINTYLAFLGQLNKDAKKDITFHFMKLYHNILDNFFYSKELTVKDYVLIYWNEKEIKYKILTRKSKFTETVIFGLDMDSNGLEAYIDKHIDYRCFILVKEDGNYDLFFLKPIDWSNHVD